MWIIVHASQKTVVMALLADRTTLVFFSVDLNGETYCFNFVLVFDVLWWILVSSVVMKRRPNNLNCNWTTRNTPSKLSRICVGGQLSANVAPNLRIASSYPSIYSKLTPPSHVMYLWLPQWVATSIVLSACSAELVRPQKKFSKPTHEITFFLFSSKFKQSFTFNGYQMKTKFPSLRIMWQQSLDGWFLSEALRLF